MAHSHIELRLNDGITDSSQEVKYEVTLLQKSLVGWHYLGGDEVDGEFGPKTEASVKSFQKEHHLEEDGIVGQRTWAAIITCQPSEVEIHSRGSSHPPNPSVQTGIASQIYQAAKRLDGMDTSAGPEGGREACLWAVNKVLKEANVASPWGESTSVPVAHDVLEQRGDSCNQQIGAIAIFADGGSPPYCHVGICIDNGLILSNSSSKAHFSWKDNPAGYQSSSGYRSSFYLIR